tara:strand:+ start:708 stop:1412 length:705 start_codon:yes stop_codon:yes gene_type:complete
MSRFYTYLIFSFFLSVATPALNQHTPLDREAWENTVGGENFFERAGNTTPVESNTSKTPRNEEDSKPATPRSSFNFSIPSWVSYSLMVVIIGALVFFIVFTILKNPGIELKTGIASLSEDDIQSIEENLFDNDLEKYIHEAKLEGDYKLAIRFSFIYIIRLLDENGIIKWRKQKTNYDYLKELEGNPFKDSFNYCKLIFENLWYGSTSFSNSALIRTLDLYTGHINNLKSKAIN